MDLVVVRHAVAEDRGAFAATGKDDSLRPLTDDGRRKMERGARGLARLAPAVEVLASSPLVRAVQTARVVAPALGVKAVEELAALAPGARPDALVPWLRQHHAASAVCVVGHEPHLGRLVAWLLCGEPEDRVTIGKGGACLVRLVRRPGPRCGELRWLLAPSHLRKLGR